MSREGRVSRNRVSVLNWMWTVVLACIPGGEHHRAVFAGVPVQEAAQAHIRHCGTDTDAHRGDPGFRGLPGLPCTIAFLWGMAAWPDAPARHRHAAGVVSVHRSGHNAPENIINAKTALGSSAAVFVCNMAAFAMRLSVRAFPGYPVGSCASKNKREAIGASVPAACKLRLLLAGYSYDGQRPCHPRHYVSSSPKSHSTDTPSASAMMGSS